MQNRFSSSLLLAILLLVNGLPFAGIAAYLFYQDYALLQNGVRVEGTVIGLATSQDEDSLTYAPVVRFTSEGGREYTFTGDVYSRPAAYEAGQTVTVLYPPDEPGKARLKGQGNTLTVVFGIIGSLEILLGLFVFGKAALSRIQGK